MWKNAFDFWLLSASAAHGEKKTKNSLTVKFLLNAELTSDLNVAPSVKMKD